MRGAVTSVLLEKSQQVARWQERPSECGWISVQGLWLVWFPINPSGKQVDLAGVFK